MIVRSILEGEFSHNYSAFVLLVQRWAGTRNLSGLDAWFDELSEYSAKDQADIVCDWVDSHCSFNEIDSCVQYLMDMGTDDIEYDDQGNILDDRCYDENGQFVGDDHLYDDMGYYIGD